MHNPVSTYRIQFHKGFTFKDFERIIPYLYRLGIKAVYASPIFEATPGSTHGYDVINPLHINPEIGTLSELKAISKKLKKLNSKFRIEVTPFNNISDNHIILFKKYSSHKPLGWPNSLTNLLLNGRQESMYNSFALNLYNGAALIGTCVFDLGNKSAAGITSFYDPRV